MSLIYYISHCAYIMLQESHDGNVYELVTERGDEDEAHIYAHIHHASSTKRRYLVTAIAGCVVGLCIILPIGMLAGIGEH